MFTGLIEEIGICLELRRRAEEIQLSLTAPGIAPHVKVGDSVAVNGCCLTVVQCNREHLHFDLLDETLQRTNLGELSAGSALNLERAVPADGRIGRTLRSRTCRLYSRVDRSGCRGARPSARI